MPSKQKLRIAVLGTRGIPNVMGGIETHCQALYPRLAARGHSITLFARKPYVRHTPYVYEGVQIIPLWSPKKKNLEAIIHTILGLLHILINDRNYDIIHIHGIGPSIVTPLFRLLGFKVVVTHHGADYERQKWGKIAKRVLKVGERLGCRYANAVIAISKHIRTSIFDLYGCSGTYIPNGVQLQEIIPPGEALPRWGLTPRKYILAMGRFVPEKGFHDLLKAFKEVDTGWKLVIAGDSVHDDAYSRSLKMRAREDARVETTGFIKGNVLGEVFSNAGLFVLPSYHEGLPIVLLEAMSYNLPVLASNIPANMELTDLSERFPVGDVASLSAKLSDCINKAKPCSNQKRKVIETDFNWDRVAKLTEELYFNA